MNGFTHIFYIDTWQSTYIRKGHTICVEVLYIYIINVMSHTEYQNKKLCTKTSFTPSTVDVDRNQLTIKYNSVLQLYAPNVSANYSLQCSLLITNYKINFTILNYLCLL